MIQGLHLKDHINLHFINHLLLYPNLPLQALLQYVGKKQCVISLLQVRLVHQEGGDRQCHLHFLQDVVTKNAPVQLERYVFAIHGLAKYADDVLKGVGMYLYRVCHNASLTKERKHQQQLNLKLFHHHLQVSNFNIWVQKRNLQL